MLDGIDLGGRTNVVALGITTDGVKIPLGLWEGSTERHPPPLIATHRSGSAQTAWVLKMLTACCLLALAL